MHCASASPSAGSERAARARDLTFAELSTASNRFANVLESLGVRAGDRVYALTGRIPELYFAALGTWKARAVLCTLFSAFGPEPMFFSTVTLRSA